MRHISFFILALALAAAAARGEPAAPPTTGADPRRTTLSAPVYVLTGGGYGHGVGLSQYGALGQAKADRSYRDILSFYYPGTTIAHGAALHGAGARSPTAARRSRSPRPSPSPSRTRPASITPLAGGRDRAQARSEGPLVDGKPTALPGPLAFTPGKAQTLTLDGKGYRGELRVTAAQEACRSSTSSALDAYLLGVVPGEMPKEWPAAALQAQAVAARSYALASLVKNRDFDLYADPRSQMYYGVAAESPATTAAVQATKGEILMYGGKVVTAFYYSSSGGRTASSADVFGLQLPYLQARARPVGHAVALPPLAAALVHAGRRSRRRSASRRRSSTSRSCRPPPAGRPRSRS